MSTDNIRAACAAWDIDYERITETVDDLIRHGVPEKWALPADAATEFDFSNAREVIAWLVSLVCAYEKEQAELKRRIATAANALRGQPVVTVSVSLDQRE